MNYPFVSVIKQPEVRDVSEAFAFRTDKRAKWLQKACFWILRKLGCYYQEAFSSTSTLTVNCKNLQELIVRQRHECQYNHGRDVEGIVLGPEESNELFREVVDVLTLKMPCDGPPEFRGMKLYCLPWAKGVTLLPKLD